MAGLKTSTCVTVDHLPSSVLLLVLQVAPLAPMEDLPAATMEALLVLTATRLPLPAPLQEAPPEALATRLQATTVTMAPHPLPMAATTGATTATGVAQRYVSFDGLNVRVSYFS